MAMVIDLRDCFSRVFSVDEAATRGLTAVSTKVHIETRADSRTQLQVANVTDTVLDGG